MNIAEEILNNIYEPNYDTDTDDSDTESKDKNRNKNNQCTDDAEDFDEKTIEYCAECNQAVDRNHPNNEESFKLCDYCFDIMDQALQEKENNPSASAGFLVLL